jgi:hypothetical protein
MPFRPGDDNFGLISADPKAMDAADRVFQFVRYKLGDSTVNVELTERDVFINFEHALMEFSRHINTYQGKSTLSNLIGTATGSLSGLEGKYQYNNLSFLFSQADMYAEAVGVGGTMPAAYASFTLTPGQQNYKLIDVLGDAYREKYGEDPSRIRIIELYHVSPSDQISTLEVGRYGSSQVGDGFWGYGTGGDRYQLLPIFDTVLRRSSFKHQANVRLSHYSYNVIGGELILYPVPYRQQQLWVRFSKSISPQPIIGNENSFSGSQGAGSSTPYLDAVSNPSNTPFGYLKWSNINALGQSWIISMALAMSKQTLGKIRRKIKSGIPIAGGENLQLDGDDLVSEGKAEIEALNTEMKELLDNTTYDKLAETEANQAESVNKQLMYIPLGLDLF